MLWDDAGGAREILKAWKPRMTKEEYLTFQRSAGPSSTTAQGL